jgi:hypothetical protein
MLLYLTLSIRIYSLTVVSVGGTCCRLGNRHRDRLRSPHATHMQTHSTSRRAVEYARPYTCLSYRPSGSASPVSRLPSPHRPLVHRFSHIDSLDLSLFALRFTSQPRRSAAQASPPTLLVRAPPRKACRPTSIAPGPLQP